MRQLEKGTDSNWAKYLCHGCEALLEVEEVLSVAVAVSLWHFQPARAGRSGPAARRAPTIVGLVRAVFTLLQPPRPLREGQRIVAQLRGEGHLPGAPLPREFGISNRRKKKTKPLHLQTVWLVLGPRRTDPRRRCSRARLCRRPAPILAARPRSP